MKRLIAVLLIVVLVISLVACSNNYAVSDYKQIETYGLVVIKQYGHYGDGARYLVYDPETNVEYIASTGSYGNFSLCPHYDETGNVAIYGG